VALRVAPKPDAVRPAMAGPAWRLVALRCGGLCAPSDRSGLLPWLAGRREAATATAIPGSGEAAVGAQIGLANMRSYDPEAVIRFGGEAPRRRPHSNERFNDHVLARVTTTSDREWPAGQDRSPPGVTAAFPRPRLAFRSSYPMFRAAAVCIGVAGR
jgi:hypothetical protein